MAKFKSRTYMIDAQRWWPPGDALHDPSMLIRRKGHAVYPPDFLQTGDLHQFSTIGGMGEDIFHLRTRRGDVRVMPGDWVLTDATGAKFVCSSQEFETMFEPV